MAAGASARPNVLWIVGEDCPPWFGCYGDVLASTPVIDALAERATLFERAYCTAPVCSPSRFSLLTGIVPESHSPADRMRSAAERPDWMTTYPESFRAAGYYCTNNQKTDYNLDVDADVIWDESSATAHWRGRPDGSPFLAVFNFDPTHESSIFDAESPLAQAMAAFAKKLRPNTGLPSPDPLVPTVPLDAVRVPRYLPDTREIRTDFAKYHEAVTRFNAFVGRLLTQLDEDGLTDKTLVLLTSDHGGVTPRSKRYLYDEGLHVPLMMAIPGRERRRWAEPVSSLSIPTTLLTLAGIDVPAQMQGEPLAGPAAPSPAEPSYAFSARGRMDERYSLVRTIRSRRFRYLRNYTPHRPVIQHQAFAWNAAGYRSWESERQAGRLTPEQERWWLPAPPVELYDLDADVDEVVNLAGEGAYAEVEADLRRRLREHILAVNDNGFLPEDSPLLGWDASREPGAYPLERVLELADLGLERDPSRLPTFAEALADGDPVVRRWAAFGLLWLAPEAGPAADALRSALPDPVPSVVVPAAEALARTTGEEAAYATLARLAEPANNVWTRLEAINALTYLDLDRVRPYRAVINDAAETSHEYLGNAGRYLRFRLDGDYTPDAVVFSVNGFFAGMAAGAGPDRSSSH
ncbi:sulfatase-like hydrolase/transferase [Amycolatopsis taiwanensis]|uniref:Sulfatase n=1 Tax=Amycolatopsis taiwanensis TaxID=342230 RepID=A0A9W6R2Q8_9PSEU|nr:sulfatase-like hydrolase/transferase [Amycolatopsis taiwanensis]GLY68178.1 sulfatase [Amycolatopsis taiwanensis]